MIGNGENNEMCLRAQSEIAKDPEGVSREWFHAERLSIQSEDASWIFLGEFPFKRSTSSGSLIFQ